MIGGPPRVGRNLDSRTLLLAPLVGSRSIWVVEGPRGRGVSKLFGLVHITARDRSTVDGWLALRPGLPALNPNATNGAILCHEARGAGYRF